MEVVVGAVLGRVRTVVAKKKELPRLRQCLRSQLKTVVLD